MQDASIKIAINNLPHIETEQETHSQEAMLNDYGKEREWDIQSGILLKVTRVKQGSRGKNTKHRTD